MPGKRSGLFTLLLPVIVLVPLGGVLMFVVISSWQAADSRTALAARLGDSAFTMAGEIGDAVERQKVATEHLSQSPLAWLWVKFQGERLTPSNRAHADISLKEIENYARLLPFAQIFLASENTRTLYKGGAAVKRLVENDPADAWYFSCLKSDEVIVTSDTRGIRTSARVMDDGQVWGAVSFLSDVSVLAASVLSNGSVRMGMTAALTNGAGEVARVEGEAPASGRTIFDLYPGSARGAVAAALSSLLSADHSELFTEAMGTHAGLTVGVRSPAPGWYLFVSSELVSPLSPTHLLWLAGVPASTLLLLLLAFILTTGRRLRAAKALLERYDLNLHAAGEAFAEIGAPARGAQTAAAQLQALAERLGVEAAALATSGAEAEALFARAEARDAELRAGIAGRLSLLGRLAAAAREAVDRSLSTEAAARIVGTSAARAEEELSRVITFSASTSHAVDKASKAVNAIVQAAERIRLLSLNAALEAAREGAQGQGFARIANEVKGMADETAARARALSASLAEAGGSVEGASRAAQEAGRAVHEASADAARAVGGGWEGMTALLSQSENADASASRLKHDASSSDRGRSALEGFARIVARIGSIAAEVAHLAGRAGADASAITRSSAGGAHIAEENRQEREIS
jgi:methyl-accepting chemotaxis protein